MTQIINIIKSNDIDKEVENIENIKRNAEISLKFKIIIAIQNQKCFKSKRVVLNQYYQNHHLSQEFYNLQYIKSFSIKNYYQDGKQYYESLSIKTLKIILKYLETVSNEYET